MISVRKYCQLSCFNDNMDGITCNTKEMITVAHEINMCIEIKWIIIVYIEIIQRSYMK